MNKKIILGALVAVSCFASLAPTAKADPPAGSGWDKTPDVALGGGSDTTYLVSQRLEVLYNGAPGCTLVTTTANAAKGRCSDTSTALTGIANGNYDHDVLASAAATGSSAGVNALLTPITATPPGTGVQYNPAIDYARSSRPISTAEAVDTTAWGYARDGIAVITFGSRTGLSLTKQDLIDIYTCQKTNWSQFGQPAGVIIPWDMNTASGTYASFRTYLGNPTFGTCVRKQVGANNGPFENDVKPLLADIGPDGVYNTADDDENNYLWWMSFGNWTRYPFTKDGVVNGPGPSAGGAIQSQLVTIDGQFPSNSTIFNSSYSIMRTLYHVTRDSDADCRQAAGTAGPCDNAANVVYGTTAGKGGAVREFTQWLCRTTAATQATNAVTGQNYRNAIIDAVNAEGFQVLSATVPGLRTTGYSCSVTTE